MVSVCRNNSVNSFFGLPPPLEEEYFSQIFHQTLGGSPPSQTPAPPPNNLRLSFNNLVKPIKAESPLTGSPAYFAGDMAGGRRNCSGIDLMSCTESLGFESSDEMGSSFDDLGRSKSNVESSSPTPPTKAVVGCNLTRKVVVKRCEERRFPAPLTTLMSENGRRNFVLKSVRKDGRLKIVRVMIDHPEILCATREDGRLRMHLVKSYSDDDELTEEAKEVAETEEEEAEEEKESSRVPAAGGLRRCNQMYGWGPQHQHRFVTTI